jgi:hypothetical protein
MLTPERKSEICTVNLAFAAEFARERANKPDGPWFDLVAHHDAEKERKYEALAPYLARQKERKLAYEARIAAVNRDGDVLDVAEVLDREEGSRGRASVRRQRP